MFCPLYGGQYPTRSHSVPPAASAQGVTGRWPYTLTVRPHVRQRRRQRRRLLLGTCAVAVAMLGGCTSSGVSSLLQGTAAACDSVAPAATQGGILDVSTETTAGQAAKDLRAAGMSPSPWDRLPANERVYDCHWPNSHGGHTAEFVDGKGHKSPAPS